MTFLERTPCRLPLVTLGCFSIATLLSPGVALAEEQIDSGDTAWMLT